MGKSDAELLCQIAGYANLKWNPVLLEYGQILGGCTYGVLTELNGTVTSFGAGLIILGQTFERFEVARREGRL